MSNIGANPVSSIAQARLTEAQRAKETERVRESDTARAEKLAAQRQESRESVADAEQTHGLAVDPDGRNDQQGRKRKPPQNGQPENQPDEGADPDDRQEELESAEQARARSAALLADPSQRDKPSPPPLMIDLEA